MDMKGLLQCSRYAFGPNSLHYCGPEKQTDLHAYITQNSVNNGLVEILNRFETLYPYLVLIASQNYIRDPFDRRVVEAYWLGNTLLQGVQKKAFGDHLVEALSLKKKIPVKHFSPMMDRVISGVPNHTFHVMNIYIRTGHHAILHTLSTMDECRISWGRVVQKYNKQYIVETKPIQYARESLTLGREVKKMVTSLSVTPKVGDWVSIHWGYVCDVLSVRQYRNLMKITDMAMTHANMSI